MQYHAYSPNTQHTRSLCTGLFSCLQMCRQFETVIWNRFHLLHVLDQTKEAPSHAQMLLQKPAFQSLQKPCRIKCVNFFYFCTVSKWFLLVILNWIKFIWGCENLLNLNKLVTFLLFFKNGNLLCASRFKGFWLHYS